MEIIDLPLQGLKLIKPKIFKDERGFFLETYRKPLYQEMECDFVQDNLSFSKKGTLRGMHFQANPGQAKLLTVLQGDIFDVAVDIRPDSPTFKQWFSVTLSSGSHEQFFIPVGFAHGFYVLSETALVCYKVSSLYNPSEEKEFRYDDPEIGIKWPQESFVLSEKDKNAPYFNQVIS